MPPPSPSTSTPPVLIQQDPEAEESSVVTRLLKEEEAYQSLLPELIDACLGKYVAIRDGRVVGIGDEEQGLADRVWSEIGYCDILIRKVGEPPPTIRLRSSHIMTRPNEEVSDAAA